MINFMHKQMKFAAGGPPATPPRNPRVVAAREAAINDQLSIYEEARRDHMRQEIARRERKGAVRKRTAGEEYARNAEIRRQNRAAVRRILGEPIFGNVDSGWHGTKHYPTPLFATPQEERERMQKTMQRLRAQKEIQDSKTVPARSVVRNPGVSAQELRRREEEFNEAMRESMWRIVRSQEAEAIQRFEDQDVSPNDIYSQEGNYARAQRLRNEVDRASRLQRLAIREQERIWEEVEQRRIREAEEQNALWGQITPPNSPRRVASIYDGIQDQEGKYKTESIDQWTPRAGLVVPWTPRI